MPGVSAIVIAAGESSRLGRPKALLPWGDKPLVQYQVSALAGAGAAEVIVVLGHNADIIAPFVRGAEALKVVINTKYQAGKTGSIKMGLREVSQASQAVLVLAVDQPRTAAFLSRLMKAHLAQTLPVTVPVFRGRRGHPPVFSLTLLPELMAIREETQGLKEITERHRDEIHELPFDTETAVLDINTEEEYKRALRLLHPAVPSRPGKAPRLYGRS
ncbi:MAG: nucleotidyltransferase family protein [Chloroflexi bacterium]|nr:nucleotidyltransferase family protein [Chloroflexota bacterium]